MKQRLVVIVAVAAVLTIFVILSYQGKSDVLHLVQPADLPETHRSPHDRVRSPHEVSAGTSPSEAPGTVINVHNSLDAEGNDTEEDTGQRTGGDGQDVIVEKEEKEDEEEEEEEAEEEGDEEEDAEQEDDGEVTNEAKDSEQVEPSKDVKQNVDTRELCPETSPHLVGNVTVNVHALTWEEVNKLHPEVLPGGIYRVKECRSRHHVAIVIPYRDRDSHLRVFLHHMIPILIRQQIDFGIYVIEQLPGSDFNRGILMNIGFVEAQKREPYPCYVFSDVDLWLENDKSIYGCPEQPRHLSVAVSKFGYRKQSYKLFGGIENFRIEHFKQVNGFSNLYFGWGGEDNDLYERVIKKGLRVIRPPRQYARYTMAKHRRASRDNPRKKLLKNLYQRIDTEGLNSLQYVVKSVKINPLHTKISVFVNQTELLKNYNLTSTAGHH